MKAFKALSLLLSYPSMDLQKAVGELSDALDHSSLSKVSVDSLRPLLEFIANSDLYDVQEHYVELFDRSRSLSLNLFEHIHGESRDRGGAMVDLLEVYRAGGFDLNAPELPDHLPVLLEFLSMGDAIQAQEILFDAGPILVALAQRLKRRQTPYAAALQALVDYARLDTGDEQAQALLAQPDDHPNDLAALDTVWEEAQVQFGPDANALSCPTAGSTHEYPVQMPRSRRVAPLAGGGRNA